MGPRSLTHRLEAAGSRVGRILPTAGVLLLVACGGIAAATDPPSETPDAPESPGSPDSPSDLAVTIVSPVSASSFYLGDTIDFEASVTDRLGAPVEAAVEWTSDLSGVLGTGTRLERDDLPSGRHTVQVVARRNGDRASAAVLTRVSECGPFDDWSSSPYVLPYPPGSAYVVNQGNCSGY
ncbi:MAG: hypothetical protein PVF05_07725, partial [Gemmatimonadales bacterium]